MNRRALKESKKVLKAEYPNILISVNNLTEILRDQGKYEEAVEMHR